MLAEPSGYAGVEYLLARNQRAGQGDAKSRAGAGGTGLGLTQTGEAAGLGRAERELARCWGPGLEIAGTARHGRARCATQLLSTEIVRRLASLYLLRHLRPIEQDDLSEHTTAQLG